MNAPALFAATVFLWGTSWIAISFQVGDYGQDVPLLVSVFFRFALAAVVMIGGLALLGRLKLPKQWGFVFVQALCLFSFNFIAFYNATTLIASGLVSLVFSLASIFNAVNARIFYREAISGRVLLAGLVGLTGLSLIFLPDLLISFERSTLIGLAWAAGGTMLFSLGNMASRKNSSLGVPPVTANAWGMGFGALVLLGLIGAQGLPVNLPLEPTYLMALVYLSVFASVIGFTTYLLLVAKVGSAKAGYATVIFPVIALALSTLFEGYSWTWLAMLGVGLILLGNYIMFSAPQRRA